MVRTKKERCTSSIPGCCGFVPQGVSLDGLQKVHIESDEYEALLLSDYEGLSMKDAAVRMKISAPTFCRILARAHSKIAEAFVANKGICFLNKPLAGL